MRPVKHPKFEGVNKELVHGTFKLLLFVGFLTYGIPWLVDFKKNNTWQRVDFQNQAFERCVSSCGRVTKSIVDVSRQNTPVDDETYNKWLETMNEVCNRECNK